MNKPNQQTVREIARQQILDDRHRAHDNGSAVLGRFGPDGLTRHEYGAYCSAIREAIRTAQIAVSWLDEQQPADLVTEDDATEGTCTMDCVMGHTNEPGCLYDTTSKLAEQQAADVVTAEVKCGRECSEMHTYERGSCEAAVTAEQQQDGAAEELRTFLDALPPRIDIVADWTRNGVRTELTAEALRAVLAERTARAARVAELESERTSLAVPLLAEPDEREADTRAVVEACAGVMDGTAPQPIRHEYAVQRLRARYADRIAALDADTDGGAE